MSSVVELNKNDLSCSLITCDNITAQVSCIKSFLQNTNGYIDIYLFNGDELLDLTTLNSIRILLFDEFESVLGNYYYPYNSGDEYEIHIIQSMITDNTIINKGLIRIFINELQTTNVPSSIFAEIKLNIKNNTESDTIIGVPCIYVANIVESKIYKNDNTGT